MRTAGGSARSEYERRKANDRRVRRDNLRRSVSIVLVAPAVVYALVRAGAWAANQWLASRLADAAAAPAQDVVDTQAAHLLGLVLAAAAALRLATDFWGARRTTEAWRKGHEGEVMTAKRLGALPASWLVLHDLPMPGSKANIDHLVIGPAGVFTIETKHYSSEVVIRRGAAFRAGRSMASVVAQAQRQAAAVRAALGQDVRAIVCVQGAGVSCSTVFGSPVVDGVRFCSGRRLVKALTRLDAGLQPADVTRLGALASQRFLSPGA